MLHMPTPMLMADSGPVNWQFMYAQPAGINRSTDVTVPAGVTSICAVAIGAGERPLGLTRGGRGGSLRYVNDIAVTPGEVLTIRIWAGGYSRLTRSNGEVLVYAASGDGNTTSNVGVGFNGGVSGSSTTQSRPGGGAGGYTSAGTSGNVNSSSGGNGSDPYGQTLGGAGYGGSTEGKNYGGGGGNEYISATERYAGNGGEGCVRIIAGPGRAFPNTLTGDL